MMALLHSSAEGSTHHVDRREEQGSGVPLLGGAVHGRLRTTIEYQGTDGDDMVITRHTTRTVRARGAYLGLMAPTAQERETRGMLIHRVSGGKIVEEWSATSGAPLLEALTQEIRERERVEHELQVARDIQLAALPEGVPTLENWQIDPYCQPAREVGGYEVG